MIYDLAEKLKYLRENKKLSQTQVAKRLNVSTSSISGYETSTKTPSVDILQSLASFYGVTTDYLLGMEHRECIVVDGLSSRQKEVINLLLTEFKSGN